MVQQEAPEETPEAPVDKHQRFKTTLTINQDLLYRFRLLAEYKGVKDHPMETKPLFGEMLGLMEQYCSGNLIEVPEGGRSVGISEENFRDISTQAVSAEEAFDDILSRVVRSAQTMLDCGFNPSELRPEETVIITISLDQLAWLRLKEKSADETNEHIVQRMCDGIDNADNIIKEEHAKYPQLVKKYNNLVKG